MRDHLAALFLAVQFLTRIPIPSQIVFSPLRSELATGYYPAVGALVGIGVAGVWWLASTWFGHPVAVVMSMLAGLLVTGAFHEDGLADTFDSFGGADTDRALGIMRDSRLGTYGVAALVSVLALKVTTLIALPIDRVILLLIIAHGLSRFSSMMVARTSTYVRDTGIAKPVAQTIERTPLLLMSVTALTLLGSAWLLGTPELCAVIAVATVLGHGLSRLCYERRLGGYTGDCLGATQQITEVTIYLGALAWLN